MAGRNSGRRATCSGCGDRRPVAWTTGTVTRHKAKHGDTALCSGAGQPPRATNGGQR
jgi:hypothetical protein